MNEHRGWLLDVYEDEQDGLVLWLLGEDDKRYPFTQRFPITFYVTGPFPRLRQLWKYLKNQPISVKLDRTQREDLFAGMIDVLAVEVTNPFYQPRLFHQVNRKFPDLTYYDADIPISLRYGATYNVFPLVYCHLAVNEVEQIQEITPLESRWDIDPTTPPLRTLIIEPNVDPSHAQPTYLTTTYDKKSLQLPIKPHDMFLNCLNARLRRYDPDIVLTRWGDTWLFPYVLDVCRKEGITYFNPNRDRQRQVKQRQANSYHTYGQVIHRGQQAHLFGRWHIDVQNAMMYGEYGLEGVFEQARVTGLPVQEIARKSPGSGVTAMQIKTALRSENKVLVPYQKQQAEGFKTARELITSDRGGLVYQPLVGLHRNVAEIDFFSMYPSAMVEFNISPETVGKRGKNTRPVPELGIPIDQTRIGLVPKTLKPLLVKRKEIKRRIAALTRMDCRNKPLKARSEALKWLLVVCFGYLGYKNARFGKIESHEAVTAYGRECLLRAKEAAEDLGFTVLHMYVDGLWVKKVGSKEPDDFQDLLDEIARRTRLSIALEGIYRWITFLPSKVDARVPVANRYFGAFQNGELKTRGIEARRHDTVPFIGHLQNQILQSMAQVPDGRSLQACLPFVKGLFRRTLSDLRENKIQPEHLLVSQTLSRNLDEYRMPSKAARAAFQLKEVGKELRPGQRVRFFYTRGEERVWAWDKPAPLNPTTLDTPYYTELMLRAAYTALHPLDIDETMLRSWLLYDAYQKPLPFSLPSI